MLSKDVLQESTHRYTTYLFTQEVGRKSIRNALIVFNASPASSVIPSEYSK
jgi:hypothetical protein